MGRKTNQTDRGERYTNSVFSPSLFRSFSLFPDTCVCVCECIYYSTRITSTTITHTHIYKYPGLSITSDDLICCFIHSFVVMTESKSNRTQPEYIHPHKNKTYYTHSTTIENST